MSRYLKKDLSKCEKKNNLLPVSVFIFSYIDSDSLLTSSSSSHNSSLLKFKPFNGDHNDDDTKFIFDKSGIIWSKKNRNLVLDVEGESKKPGTHIILYACSGKANQAFQCEKVRLIKGIKVRNDVFRIKTWCGLYVTQTENDHLVQSTYQEDFSQCFIVTTLDEDNEEDEEDFIPIKKELGASKSSGSGAGAGAGTASISQKMKKTRRRQEVDDSDDGEVFDDDEFFQDDRIITTPTYSSNNSNIKYGIWLKEKEKDTTLSEKFFKKTIRDLIEKNTCRDKVRRRYGVDSYKAADIIFIMFDQLNPVAFVLAKIEKGSKGGAGGASDSDIIDISVVCSKKKKEGEGGAGYGGQLMTRFLNYTDEIKTTVRLDALFDVIGFYSKFGFEFKIGCGALHRKENVDSKSLSRNVEFYDLFPKAETTSSPRTKKLTPEIKIYENLLVNLTKKGFSKSKVCNNDTNIQFEDINNKECYNDGYTMIRCAQKPTPCPALTLYTEFIRKESASPRRKRQRRS
jgi:hypothetical protein